MKRRTVEAIDLALICAGDWVRFSWEASVVEGTANRGLYGELFVVLAGQPVTFARPSRGGVLAPLPGVRVLGHQPGLF